MPPSADTRVTNMAASLSILSKVVGNKVEGLFKSDDAEKVPPSEKELKVQEKPLILDGGLKFT